MNPFYDAPSWSNRAIFAALLVVSALFITSSALASGAVWVGKRVPVFDHTGGVWREIVRESIDEINAIMPKRAPRFDYISARETPCDGLLFHEHPRGIQVCLVDGPEFGGYSSQSVTQHEITNAEVRLPAAEESQYRDNAACHELMHATTDIPDRDFDPELIDQSCVLGELTVPGPLDRTFARNAYRKFGDRDPEREHKHHKRQRGHHAHLPGNHHD